MLEIKLDLRINENIVVDGFCYEFTLCLLERLQELFEKGEIYCDGEKKCSIFSSMLIRHLCDQLKVSLGVFLDYSDGIVECEKYAVKDLISDGEQFLDIFVKRSRD